MSFEDSLTEKSGGLAFDVILKPAVSCSPRVLKVDTTPSKETSQELIDKKLQDAKERRELVEATKLLSVLKDKERCQEVSQRIQELNDSFSRDAEKKLSEKMELSVENKSSQIKALQERLKEHAQKVEEVRNKCDQYRVDLKEKIELKQLRAGEKREAHLSNLQDRIRKHKQHVDDVLEASAKFSKDTEEKLIQKMESSLKKREEEFSRLMERLKCHELHVQQVRQNKLNQSASSDSISCNDSVSTETAGSTGDVSDSDSFLMSPNFHSVAAQ